MTRRSFLTAGASCGGKVFLGGDLKYGKAFPSGEGGAQRRKRSFVLAFPPWGKAPPQGADEGQSLLRFPF